MSGFKWPYTWVTWIHSDTYKKKNPHQCFQQTTQNQQMKKKTNKKNKTKHTDGDSRRMPTPSILLKQKRHVEFFLSSFSSERKTNTPLHKQKFTQQLRTRQVQSGHTCLPRELSSFSVYLENCECVPPAVLWQAWTAYILLHCIFLVEPVLQHIPSFLNRFKPGLW